MTIYDVFKTQGVPTITYVERDSGDYEKQLTGAIMSRGTICLLTGASKTGKTTLYNKSLNDLGLIVIKVQCNDGLSAEDVWRSALEKVDFSRATQVTNEDKHSEKLKSEINIGWVWLAKLCGTVGTELGNEQSESKARELVLARPCPDHLVPLLQKTSFFLVVEDFHFLKYEVQVTLFQQWKAFVDEELSMLVVSTSQHSHDMIQANPNLTGRIVTIPLGMWNIDDMLLIPEQGFLALNMEISGPGLNVLAEESLGLPIIMQACCLELAKRKQSCNDSDSEEFYVDKHDAYEILHSVARQRFSGMESYYDRLTRGPRRRARKYDTYELLLTLLNRDPVKFSMQKEEIVEGIYKIAEETVRDIPPLASINSTLNAINDFQSRINVQLVEWVPTEEILYIVEPTFLFYVRWREAREAKLNLIDFFHEIARLFKGS